MTESEQDQLRLYAAWKDARTVTEGVRVQIRALQFTLVAAESNERLAKEQYRESLGLRAIAEASEQVVH